MPPLQPGFNKPLLTRDPASAQSRLPRRNWDILREIFNELLRKGYVINDATDGWKLVNDTIAIGDTITGGRSDGSVLYIDSNGELAISPVAGFFYDHGGTLGSFSSATTLYVGTAGTSAGGLVLAAAAGTSDSVYIKNGGNGTLTFFDGDTSTYAGVTTGAHVLVAGGSSGFVTFPVAAQTVPFINVKASILGASYFQINKGGYPLFFKTSAIDDADVSSSSVAIWLTDTSGAPVVNFKGKDGGSNVFTVALYPNGVRVVTAAGAVTVAKTDYIVVVNKSSGAATTVNLPSSPVTGQKFIIKDGKGDAATNNITITPASGNIDGAATFVIAVNYGGVEIAYNGTQWNVLQYFAASSGVTTTGSPANGNLTKFSGAATITNADLTGDVTTSGGVATTIANDAVTYAKMQDVSAASRVLGRGSASGSGNVEELTLGSGLSLSGTTLSAASGSAAVISSGTYGSRPSAGTAGRLYFATDNRITYLDNGSSWGIVNKGPRSLVYEPFVPGTYDDEFDDESFSGWTAVNDGSASVPTYTEGNDRLNINVPGGESAGELAAQMKNPGTINVGAYIECFVKFNGTSGNYNQFCLLFADGATFGAGSQAPMRMSISQNLLIWSQATNYQTEGTAANGAYLASASGWHGLRMTYSAANTFLVQYSADGLSWVTRGTLGRTLTPTHVGFATTTWGVTAQCTWSLLYFKFVNG